MTFWDLSTSLYIAIAHVVLLAVKALRRTLCEMLHKWYPLRHKLHGKSCLKEDVYHILRNAVSEADIRLSFT